jgi:hypothetical protein
MTTKKAKAKIGDVFEIETPAGLAYVQFTHDLPQVAQLVRVLPGLYPTRPDVRALAQQKELYFAFYFLSNAFLKGQVAVVSNEPVPSWAKPFPTMRHRAWDGSCWFIGEGSLWYQLGGVSRMQKVLELTPEQRKLSISSYLSPHPAMVKELARGWTPERDDEFQRLDALEGQADDARNAESADQEPTFVDHYLYFPKKSNAERAAQRLTAKDWAVEVKRGADGESWLTLARQPAPIEEDIEEIRDELERLAGELGGEYDGWGAAVKDDSNVQ